MPLYEYSCRECEHTFEALVFDGDTVECPECRSRRLQRLLSLPGRPKTDTGSALPMACNSDGPPCGAPWCRRKG